MITTRIDTRLDKDIKDKAKKSATLLGLNDPTQIIAQHEAIILKGNKFNQFIATCEQAKAPNKALLDAKTFATNSINPK